MAGPEHTFQTSLLKLARLVITAPFRIRAFDRGRDFSGNQHRNEAKRGVRRGTPDTEVLCGAARFHSVNLELKKPGTRHLAKYKPSDDQEREMQFLRDAGAYADVAYSCVEALGHWRAAGVPLRSNADEIAYAYDLSLCAAIESAPKAKRKPRSAEPGLRRRTNKPTAARIKRVTASVYGVEI